MNLLRMVIMVTRAPDAATSTNDLSDLRSSRASTYAWFHEKSWLDQDMILALITLLERWSAGPGAFRCYLPDTRYIDERALFEDVITRPTSLTFQNLVQLAGYVQYLVHTHGEIDPAGFNCWMRVVSNLATNTDYNRPEDLRRSFAGLRDLTPWMDKITHHLAGPDGDVRGFFRDQVAEERIKAHLLGFGEGWPERIDRAEQHAYFRGQVGFLLRFCGVDLDDPDTELARIDSATAQALSAPFERYFYCAAQMFDDIVKDPKETGQLWERALLATGNFLLPIGPNYSLLTPAQDVAWSWKRLLRNAAAARQAGQVLKNLWDHLGEPTFPKSDLIKIIETESRIDPWRRAIVATPSVYDFGLYKMLRFSDQGGIYLLRKSQMNGRHAELFTYCLYEDLKAGAEPLSLMTSYRETISTDDEPGLSFSRRLNQEDVRLYLRYKEAADRYELQLEKPQETEGELRAVLEDEGFEMKNGCWTRLVDRAEMKATVLALDGALAQNV